MKRAIKSWQQGRFTGAIQGDTRVISPLLDELRVPWMWDRTEGAYMISRARLDDVLAALELAGHVVEYRMASW